MTMRFTRSIALFVILMSSQTAWARPEYAAKEKLNCFACHDTPWGGGPRNVFGKIYGNRGLGQSKTSTTDLYYADIRSIAYYALQNTTTTTHGVALMEAAATLNAPILQNPDGSEMSGVLTYNLAPLGGAQLREAYARFRLANADTPGKTTYFVVGHFYVPFGLLTDEHRTYVRIQTNMNLNNYDTGVAMSKNFSEALHLDVALVNDFQSSGSLSSGDILYGAVANLRWNPVSLPFLLGTSANYEHTNKQPQPYAVSVYGALSLDQLTHNAVSGSLQIESVGANHWNNPVLNNGGGINPGLDAFFIPSSASNYQAQTTETASWGNYILAKYNLTHQFTLFGKFDYLALNTAELGQNYTRYGMGFEAYLNTNLILNVRTELATTPNQNISNSTVLAAQNDVFAMLRLWF
jgi:hypothetical protein